MSFQAYQQLIDQFCQHAGLRDPQTMYHRAEVRIGSTDFLLLHGGKQAPDMVTVYCGLGGLPPAAQREAALLALLETNLLLFGSGSNPSFAFNRESGAVLLVCALQLGSVGGMRMLELLTHFDALAKAWRDKFFLDAPGAAVQRQSATSGAGPGGGRGLPAHLARVLVAKDQIA